MLFGGLHTVLLTACEDIKLCEIWGRANRVYYGGLKTVDTLNLAFPDSASKKLKTCEEICQNVAQKLLKNFAKLLEYF